MASRASPPKNIIVVGAGSAGVETVKALCRALPQNFRVILVTQRAHFIHMPALPRLIVRNDADLANGTILPYDQFLQSFDRKNIPVSIRNATLVKIEENVGTLGGNVVLSDGSPNISKLPYTYLVLATGRSWEGPLEAVGGSRKRLDESLVEWRDRIKSSQNIVIAGAGSVGLELAGEILDEYPNKNITIIHNSGLPLNTAYPKAFRLDIKSRWERRSRNNSYGSGEPRRPFFIFSDRIEHIPPYTGKPVVVVTNGGKELTADLIIPARGASPNTDYLQSFGDEVLDAKGYVKVAQTLQVHGHPEIYAVGDIISWNHQKTLAKTPGQASVAAGNILHAISGRGSTKLYKGMFEGIFVTNGKDGGAGYVGILWGPTFGNKVVSLVKSRGLFVEMGQKAIRYDTKRASEKRKEEEQKRKEAAQQPSNLCG